MEFIGRGKEQKLIKDMLQDDQFESILIYGRRRIGKSSLIKKCMQDSTINGIYYVCKQTTEMNNVESMSALISESMNLPKLAFSTMEELLEFQFKQAIHQKQILVLDEYTYLRDKVEGLDSILQRLIDQYKDTSKLKLIICGSYIDIMKSLILVHNPLYGRFSRTIDVKQMDYYDSSKFYQDFSDEDKVRLFSVFGGVPYYNKLIDSHKTVKENIIELIASPDARLEMEVLMYLKSEISKLANVNEVIEAMAMGYSKYSDIYEKSNVSSIPTLVDVLEKLIKMEVIKKEAPINDINNKKKSGYFISDNLSYFYYKYIFHYLSQMSVMDPDIFYDRYIKDDFETQYVPKMFESICKQYLIRCNKEGRITEPFEMIGKYYYDDPIHKKNGEFDIVTKDRLGYIFYECKYKNKVITNQIVQEEIQQVKDTGLLCYRYGFFSKHGFDDDIDADIVKIELRKLFKEFDNTSI